MKVLSWQNKNKKSSASQVNTDLQNASRNIDPPDTSIGPGGGKIKQKYNLNASHQPRSSRMPSLYLLLIQKLGMNTCKKTNRTTKQLQRIVNSPCKEKKERQKPCSSTLLLFSYQVATAALFMFWSDHIQSRATNKGRSVVALASCSEDPFLTRPIGGAPPDICMQLHNPDGAVSRFIISDTS